MQCIASTRIAFARCSLVSLSRLSAWSALTRWSSKRIVIEMAHSLPMSHCYRIGTVIDHRLILRAIKMAQTLISSTRNTMRLKRS